MDFSAQVMQTIHTYCNPLRVILYGEKRTLATDKLKSASICIVIPNQIEKEPLQRQLYLSFTEEIPINLTLYTAQEWHTLLEDQTSYAAWIDRKGRVLYEQNT